MSRTFVPSEALIHTPLASSYALDLLPEIQSMLKALADVEIRYKRERDRVSRSSEPDEVKKRALARLRDRRRREREPYVRRLAVLECRMKAISELGFSCAIH